MTGLHVLILHHDGGEEERDLEVGSWSIGRAEENWLCPLDTALSRRHAVLHVSEGAVWVESLPTRNGTFVNGELVGDDGRQLRPGDEVLVGRTLIRLLAGRGGTRARRHQSTAELGRASPEGETEIVAVSAEMLAILERCRRLARSPLPVLVTGESGTGKELLARAIHRWSGRQGPFVILNCPALAGGLVESELFGVEAGVATGVTQREGRLELADGGTLFLDEVGDLSAEAQAKLLRFLHDGTLERVGGRNTISVDVRVLAATNRRLDPDSAEVGFRSDLFFRVSALQVEIPPLRHRRADILPLVDWFLLRTGHGQLRLRSEARDALLAYHFPGNVRELAAIVERAGLLAEGGLIGVEELGLHAAPEAGGDDGAGVQSRALALLDEVVRGEADFWEAVYRPFVERELSRAVVRELVAVGLERCGGTVRSLAVLLQTPARYRKLLDFLRNNRLMPE